ncbi:Heat-inducible transcription repressor HrcA [Bacteroides xylanisolvens]|nr:Heat-inducible transcription repressor HrcA [Bacteroides xylanisolvens]
MQDLEDEGYLEQPHTSAGRIPSIKGYRFYVDWLMQPAPVSSEEEHMIDHMLMDHVNRQEEIFRNRRRNSIMPVSFHSMAGGRSSLS